MSTPNPIKNHFQKNQNNCESHFSHLRISLSFEKKENQNFLKTWSFLAKNPHIFVRIPKVDCPKPTTYKSILSLHSLPIFESTR